MTTLCLTGWQQPHDALSEIVPDAEHFDYGAYDDIRKMFAALPKSPHVAVGWSLGGQLLVRAIAGGFTKPETLILLGAPFQWVADERFAAGIPADHVGEIRNNYARDRETMLKNLNSLIALGDVMEKPIIRTLNKLQQPWPNGGYWLEELVKGSCHGTDFSVFPRTVIIHGLRDRVIHPDNARAFASQQQVELYLWPACGHAPHLHDPDVLRDIVSDYV